MDIDAVTTTWYIVALNPENIHALIGNFRTALVETRPDLARRFTGSAEFAAKLGDLISNLVIHGVEYNRARLQELGHHHRASFDNPSAVDYQDIEDAFMKALACACGDEWTEAAENQWRAMYRDVATIMQ